jgi:hypothetical protein
MAQVVKHLLNKGEALSSNNRTLRKKKKRARWCTSVIPTNWEAKTEGLWFQVGLGLSQNTLKAKGLGV